MPGSRALGLCLTSSTRETTVPRLPATCGAACSLCLLDTTAAEALRYFPGHSIPFAPSPTWVAICCRNGTCSSISEKPRQGIFRVATTPG
ncbi:hypothetical protein CCHR01_01206 [Colletotrichum chrysophilum]|uniref:Uncharacterized protein n=1 Tax=Colletotrichum chrysophilum TaxID=1836956 RepID=A0AAD9ETI5_9PEZI|nr:hypothetical protein CCHR01_01206 [Colletotrichum chrysophilum]